MRAAFEANALNFSYLALDDYLRPPNRLTGDDANRRGVYNVFEKLRVTLGITDTTLELPVLNNPGELCTYSVVANTNVDAAHFVNNKLPGKLMISCGAIDMCSTEGEVAALLAPLIVTSSLHLNMEWEFSKVLIPRLFFFQQSRSSTSL